ncbi:MAG: 50S ribosomal protein L4 [Chloroflexota bacterium]|nr:50S ribosomal protein L4 [Chloroflexota bacterium]
MEIEVKNNLGKTLKSLDLDPSVWGQDFNADLLHQSIQVYLANQRQWTKGTKTRANVNYAGQKLRPQKGSGRARVGSKRSPIMVGGGVAHGPHPKNIRKSLNKKMKSKALKIALSAKLKDSEVNIIEKIPVENSPSTKNVIDCLRSLELQGSILFVSNENNKVLKKSCENIENVNVIEASMLNVYQLLKPKNIILELNAVEKIQALWGNPEFKAPAKKAPAKKAPVKKTRKTVKKDA